jgi:predicted DNA-binding protein
MSSHSMPSSQKRKNLVQALVEPSTLRKLDALAKTRHCKRATYVRHVLETHVQSVTPEILRSLEQTLRRET